MSNRRLLPPPAQKLWFESFRSAGGRGELVVVPPFPERILAELSRGGYRRHCRIIELEIT